MVVAENEVRPPGRCSGSGGLHPAFHVLALSAAPLSIHYRQYAPANSGVRTPGHPGQSPHAKVADVSGIVDGEMVVDTGEVDENGDPVLRPATDPEQRAAILRSLEGQVVL